jgi:L-ascorbate metabolism protein UlaG (beta-lactamase superfamily)
MRASRHGQSAFTLDGDAATVFIDPWGDMSATASRGAHLAGIDLMFVPVGGGPTINRPTATGIAIELGASWVVPMHYRTAKINFLDDETDFVEAMPSAVRLESPSFDTADLQKGEPTAIVPAAP